MTQLEISSVPRSPELGVLFEQAAMNGTEEREIARTTGHHSVDMVRRYIHGGRAFGASAQLG
ncbi:hypothetical protein HNQ77_005178 [Silvibacterium bohemicum]|uniref:Integrase n=1 Tax=Silvibacterium bohemicum TaxID=1577686 RepID=A0A841KA63_9BACT|nr:hypothetical protein [Silvibacterium bohemicum]MBB6147184.1 hypothetical protein [Silvibacterium bohemicum]